MNRKTKDKLTRSVIPVDRAGGPIDPSGLASALPDARFLVLAEFDTVAIATAVVMIACSSTAVAFGIPA